MALKVHMQCERTCWTRDTPPSHIAPYAPHRFNTVDGGLRRVRGVLRLHGGERQAIGRDNAVRDGRIDAGGRNDSGSARVSSILQAEKACDAAERAE